MKTSWMLIFIVAFSLAANEAPRANGSRFIGGEKIKLFVSASVGETIEQIVGEDGEISIQTGDIVNIKGKTVSEAQALIKGKLEAGSGAKRVVVALAILDVPPRRIFLSGEVKTPQALVLTPGSPLTLAAALASVGGATPEADLSRVRVLRTNADGSQKVMPYDASMLNQSSADLGPVLEPSDVVHVPRGEVFVLAGEVVKPGPYNRRDLSIGFGEKVRLSRVLFGSGGLKATANRKDVRLIRTRAGGEKEVSIVNLDSAIRSSSEGAKDNADPVLSDGDIILAGTTGGVAIFGRVRTPGVYPLGGEKLKLTRLIAMAGGFQEFAKSSVTCVKASNPQSPMQIDVNAIMKRGDVAKDIELEDGDLIFVGERML